MWLLYSLAATLIWGAAELFYKKGADPNEEYSHLKTAVFVGIVMGVHAVFTLLTQNIGYDPLNVLIYLPVSLLYVVSMGCSFFGIKYIEESIADPIENTSGAICSLLCIIFLGERLSLLSVFAIIAITVGVIGTGLLENVEVIKKRKKISALALAMPFAYAVLDAFGSFLDIYYIDDPAGSPLRGVTADNIEDVANTSYELTFALCAAVLLIFLKRRGVSLKPAAQKDKIAAAVLETSGQFFYVYAMAENGAAAAPVLSSVCAVSLLLSRIFLKEKLTGLQYVFIGIIIIGIIMLA